MSSDGNWVVFRNFLVVLLVFAGGTSCGGISRTSSSLPVDTDFDPRQLFEDTERVLVVAHRACWREAPENSLSAIEACIQLGVDMIEIDARRTRDGHLVVIHDDTVDRTTNGRGFVNELTLAEIQTLKLRQGAGGAEARITEARVPTLAEALTAAKDRILVNIDVKGNVREQAFAVATNVGVADQILIKMSLSSPDEFNFAGAPFYGNSYFMPIIRERNGDLAAQVEGFREIDAVAFELIYETERQLEQACAKALERGSRCWINTMWDRLSPGHADDVAVLEPDVHWGHLYRIGVNMFQTDRPAAMIAYFDELGLRR